MRNHDQYILQTAITIVNNRLAEMTLDDLRCYTFDRMVDEVYDELVNSGGKMYGECTDCGG